jgi:hypothetical protein
MLYHLEGVIMSDGSLNWGSMKGHFWEKENGAKLSFFPGSENRREARKKLVSAITKENLSWITYTGNKWILDLDKFKEFIALIFGADTLTQIPWEWFKGKHTIEPEYETEERSDFGKSRYETRFDFYIVREVCEEEKVKKSEVVNYVDEERIKELASLPKDKFDSARLVKLCEELNKCYKNNCELAVAAMVRTILNHVPPIFKMSNFEEVANNYSWGKGKLKGKSKRKVMSDLEDTARNIADIHLHQPIRETESLPSMTQVNFKNQLDVLLEEIVRILKSQAKGKKTT